MLQFNCVLTTYLVCFHSHTGTISGLIAVISILAVLLAAVTTTLIVYHMYVRRTMKNDRGEHYKHGPGSGQMHFVGIPG